MGSQKTLDGQTVAFIAAIAKALSQNISSKRQEELVRRPQELRRLLLPLVHDEWISLSVSLIPGKKKQLVWIDGSKVQPSEGRTLYTVQDTLNHARARGLQIMDKARAVRLCKLVCQDNPPFRNSSFRNKIFFFPFAGRNKVRFLMVDMVGHMRYAKVNKTTNLIEDSFFFFLQS